MKKKQQIERKIIKGRKRNCYKHNKNKGKIEKDIKEKQKILKKH